MSLDEFWVKLAKREGLGRSPGELMAEFERDCARVSEQERLRYYDPAMALEWLREAVREFCEVCNGAGGFHSPYDPGNSADVAEESYAECPACKVQIERVLKVWEVNYSSGVGGTSIRMLAEVLVGPQEVRWILAWYRHWFGSRTEPPNWDGGWCWIPLVGTRQ